MTIHAFTPVSALVGGVMIGSAALGLFALNGRMAGISGILAGLLQPHSPDTPWRAAFIGGLVIGGFFILFFAPAQIGAPVTASWLRLAAAGLLVGVGTRLGGGCTSGHGICGIGRLSRRSFVATCLFIVSGAVTVFIARRFFP